MNIRKLFLKVSFLFFIFSISFVAFISQVKADPLKPVDVTGWAWSSNTGWISFNCLNTGTCGTANYGVKVATSSSVATSGTISGYAWSSNIGWIKFAGDSSLGFADPTVDLSQGTVSGYIRACTGTINKDCASADRTDGWNGWAKLSESPLYPTNQTTGTGGVTYVPSSGTFVGYSWAGENIGWLKFNAASPVSNNIKCFGCNGTNGPTFTPTCTIPSLVTYTSPATSGSVNVSASSIDGTAPYSFSISTLTNLPAGPYTSGNIVVTDSSNPPKVANMTCSFTVVSGTPLVSGFNMWAMASQSSADKTKFSVAVKLGQDAYVNWEAVGGMTFDVNDCAANLKSPAGVPPQALSALNSQVVSGYYKIPSSLLTSKGDYRYSMNCTDTNYSDQNYLKIVSAKSTDPNFPSSLTIKVKDPKEIEK